MMEELHGVGFGKSSTHENNFRAPERTSGPCERNEPAREYSRSARSLDILNFLETRALTAPTASLSAKCPLIIAKCQHFPRPRKKFKTS
jgi:hypothetical protein